MEWIGHLYPMTILPGARHAVPGDRSREQHAVSRPTISRDLAAFRNDLHAAIFGGSPDGGETALLAV